jgi:hypothetical protein
MSHPIFTYKFSQSIADGDFVFDNQKRSHQDSPHEMYLLAWSRGTARGQSEAGHLGGRSTVASLWCWPLSRWLKESGFI